MRAARRPQLATRAVVRTRRAAALAGLLYCGNCGAKLFYDHHARDERGYYRCSCRKNGGHCRAPSVKGEQIEGAVGDLVGCLALPDEVRARARALVAKEPAPAPPPADPIFVRERLRRLARAYADGAYSDEEYASQRAQLETLLNVAPIAPRRVVNVERALALLDNLPALWQAATGAERRVILAQVISQVYVHRGVVLAIRPTILAEPVMIALWSGTMDGFWAIDGRRPILLTAA